MGTAFITPVDKTEEEQFKKEDSKKSILVLPKEGIPENQKQDISVMSKEEFNNIETNYVFNGSIFDY